MRGLSRITHSLRLPAHADASSPTAGASLCLEMRRFGPVANEGAEWAVASFWTDDAAEERNGAVSQIPSVRASCETSCRDGSS